MARQGGGRGAMTRGGGRGGGRGGRIQGGGRGGARGRSRGGGRIQGRRGGGTSPGGRKGGRNAGGNSGSSGKGPRLSTQLLRAIGASGNQGNAGSDDDHDDKETAGDVYEYEEGIPEEERGKNKRFDDIDQMEYELPSDFEDEEIDEDEAFGHEDREVEDEGDTPSLPKGKKTKEISLNEDYDDDEDDDDDDDDSDDDDLEDEEGVVGGRLDLDSDESVDESGGEEEEEEEDEEDDDERHQRLIDAVTGRAAKPDRDHRRRKGQVITEAYPESEFNLNPSGSSASGNAPITVQDLMNPLHDAAGFGTLRKRMEQLEKRGAPVEAPLPKVIQDRVDRKAGYEQTSADIALWQDVVKRNREAPTLIFNRREEAPTLTTATLANHFKPSNDFEKEIQKLLNQSKLMEAKDVEQAEVLELNKLTVEEVRERQHRLAKMRDLLFRHETKAKRVRKIKSKTYHKLLQKSERSKAEHDMALTEADPEAAKEAAIKQEFLRAQERMTLKHKNQSRWAKRILKRGLKAQENDGTRDAIADQLRTHALLTRKIHSATFGGSDDDSSNSEDDMESGDNEPTGLVLNPKTKVLAKAKVATLKALEDGDDDEVPKTGLFAIPFMARAIEKKKKAAELEAIEMIELIEQAEADGDILAFADDYVKLENAEKNETTQSKQRMKISATSTSELECSSKVVDDHAGVDFTTNSVARVFSTGVEDVPPKQLTTNYAVTFEEEPENKGVQVSNGNNGINSPPINENGVISTGLSKTNGCEEVPTVEVSPAYSGKRKKKQRKPKVNGVLQTRNGEKDSSAKQYVHGGTPKRPKKAANGTAVAAPLASNGDKDDSSNHYVVGFAGRPKTDSNNVGVRDAVQDNGQSRELSSNGEVQSTKMKEDAVTVATAQVSSFTDDDSDDAQELPNDLASQQELIRQAFAGDDVEAEFEQLKSQALDVEVLQGEGPVSLPGWGQWSHIQQRKGQPAWILKEQEELKRKRDNALDKRKDAKLKHVIISEKTDKKASKFSAANLPFPFKSKELYESSVRMPIGRDYNTDKAFRDMIRPAVIKSAGRIIDPIKREKPTAKETEMAASLSSRRKRPKK